MILSDRCSLSGILHNPHNFHPFFSHAYAVRNIKMIFCIVKSVFTILKYPLKLSLLLICVKRFAQSPRHYRDGIYQRRQKYCNYSNELEIIKYKTSKQASKDKAYAKQSFVVEYTHRWSWSSRYIWKSLGKGYCWTKSPPLQKPFQQSIWTGRKRVPGGLTGAELKQLHKSSSFPILFY